MKKPLRIHLSVFFLFFSCVSVYTQTKPDALVRYRAKQFEEAVSICLAEISENDKNVESYVVLSWSLVELKRYEEAERWAVKGRAVSRYDPRLIEIQGQASFYLGNNEQALRLFQEYISYAPNGSRIAGTYAFMGEIYLRLAKYRHADIAFTSALQAESLNQMWWIRLGYAREMALDYRYSLEAYNKALEINANLQDATRGRQRVISKLN